MSLLKTTGLCKSFGGVHAVVDFSMELSEGEIVGIIGPNGAGKTTIFNLISKVYDIDKGTVELDGKDITGMKQTDVAIAGISRTFQNVRLFTTLSVLENVMVACDYEPRYTLIESMLSLPRKIKGEREIRKKALHCLEMLDMVQYCDLRPNNMPYGLQRRLEIARALAMNPKVLLLDEPGAGLNPEEIMGLVGFIREIKEKFNVSIVIIDHRMDIIMNLCNRIYVQDFGKSIAYGTPEEIQNNPAVLKAYLGEDE